MVTRVKICGITHPDDALMAVRAGADALGFVMYEPSPRFVDAPSAQKNLCPGAGVCHSSRTVRQSFSRAGR